MGISPLNAITISVPDTEYDVIIPGEPYLYFDINGQPRIGYTAPRKGKATTPGGWVTVDLSMFSGSNWSKNTTVNVAITKGGSIELNELQVRKGDTVVETISTSGTYTYSFPSSGEYTFRAVTTRGNGDSGIYTVKIDKLKPKLSLTGFDGSSQIHKKNSSVTIGASDQESGMSSLRVVWTNGTINETTWLNKDSTQIFDFPKSGSYEVVATDLAENYESETFLVLIDKELPVVTLASSETGWTNGNVVVTALGTDEISDINPSSYEYSVETNDNWKPMVDRKYTATSNVQLYIRVKDNAENLSPEKSISVTNIDKLNPTVSIVATPTIWTNGSVSLAATTSDTGGSDIKSGSLYPGASLTVTTNGTYSFTVLDNAGNPGTASFTVTTIDKKKPILEMTSSVTGWTNSSTATLEYKAFDSADGTDEPSGIKSLRYSWGDGVNYEVTSLAANGSFSVPLEENKGLRTLTVTLTDHAGNQAEQSVVIGRDSNINFTVPSALLTPTQGTANAKSVGTGGTPIGELIGGEYLNYQELQVSIAKAASSVDAPLASYEIRENTTLISSSTNFAGSEKSSGNYTVTLDSFSQIATGVHSYTVTVTDEAGNVGSFGLTVNHDKSFDPVPRTADLSIPVLPMVSGGSFNLSIANGYWDYLSTADENAHFSAGSGFTSNTVSLKFGTLANQVLSKTARTTVTALTHSITGTMTFTLSSKDKAGNTSDEKTYKIVTPVIQSWSLVKSSVTTAQGLDYQIEISPTNGSWNTAPTLNNADYSYRRYFKLLKKVGSGGDKTDQQIGATSTGSFVITSQMISNAGYLASIDTLSIEQYWAIDKKNEGELLTRTYANESTSTVYAAVKSLATGSYTNLAPQVTYNPGYVTSTTYLGPKQSLTVPNGDDPEDTGNPSVKLVVAGVSGGATTEVVCSGTSVGFPSGLTSGQIAGLKAGTLNVSFVITDSSGGTTSLGLKPYLYEDQAPKISGFVWPVPATVDAQRFANSSKVMNTRVVTLGAQDTPVTSGLASASLTISGNGLNFGQDWGPLTGSIWTTGAWNFGSDKLNGVYRFTLNVWDKSNNEASIFEDKAFDQTEPTFVMSQSTGIRQVGSDGLLDLGTVSDPDVNDYHSGVAKVGISEDDGAHWGWIDAVSGAHVVLDWSAVTTRKSGSVKVQVVDWAGNVTTSEPMSVAYDAVSPHYSMTIGGLIEAKTKRRILADPSKLTVTLQDNAMPIQIGVTTTLTRETETPAGQWNSEGETSEALLKAAAWINGVRYRIVAVVANQSGKTQTIVGDDFYYDATAPSAISMAVTTAAGGQTLIVGEPFDVVVTGGVSEFSEVERTLVLSLQNQQGIYEQHHLVTVGSAQAITRTMIGVAGNWKIQARSVNEAGLETLGSESALLSVKETGWVLRAPAYVAPGQTVTVSWTGGTTGVGQKYKVEVFGVNAVGVETPLTTLESESNAKEFLLDSQNLDDKLRFQLTAYDSQNAEMKTVSSLPTYIDRGQLAFTDYKTSEASDGRAIGLQYGVVPSRSGLESVEYFIEKLALVNGELGWTSIVPWANLGASTELATQVPLVGLGLIQGDRIRVHLLATDGVRRVQERISGTIAIDQSAPPQPVVEVQEEAVRPNGNIHVSWGMSPLDPESGIDGFEIGWYVVGQSVEPTHSSYVKLEAENWQSAMVAQIPCSDFSNGQKIAVQVKAINRAGLSSVTRGPLVVIDTNAPLIDGIKVLNQDTELVGWVDSPQSISALEATTMDGESKIKEMTVQIALNGSPLGVVIPPMQANPSTSSLYTATLTPSESLSTSTSDSEKVYRLNVASRDAAGNIYRQSSFGIQVAPVVSAVTDLVLQADRTQFSLSWKAPSGQSNAVSGYWVTANNLTRHSVFQRYSATPYQSISWGIGSGNDLQVGEGDELEFSVETISRTGGHYPKVNVPKAVVSVELSPPVATLETIPREPGVGYWYDDVNGEVAYTARYVSQLRWRAVDANSGVVLVNWQTSNNNKQLSFQQPIPGLVQGQLVRVETMASNGMGVWSQLHESRPVMVDTSTPEVLIIDRNNRYANAPTVLPNLRVKLQDAQSGILKYKAQLIPVGTDLAQLPDSAYDALRSPLLTGSPDVYENQEFSVNYGSTGSTLIPEGKYNLALKVENGTGHWFSSLAMDNAGIATEINIDRTSPEVSIDLAGAYINQIPTGHGNKSQYIINEVEARTLKLTSTEPVVYANEVDPGLNPSPPQAGSEVVENDGTVYYTQHLSQQSVPIEPTTPKEYVSILRFSDRAGNTGELPLYVRYNLSPVIAPTTVSDTTPGRLVGLSRFITVSDPEWDFPMRVEWTTEVGGPVLSWTSTNKNGEFFSDELTHAYSQQPLLAQETAKQAKIRVTDRWNKSVSIDYVLPITVHNTHSGELYANEYWSGEHAIEGSILVGINKKLTIAAGTAVTVVPGSTTVTVESKGELEVQDGVDITSSSLQPWGTILVRGKASFGAAQIRNADRAVTVVSGADATLTGTTLKQNTTGLHVLGTAKVVVTGAKIIENLLYGIKEDSGGRPKVTGSQIKGNPRNYYSWDGGLLKIDEINALGVNPGNTGE